MPSYKNCKEAMSAAGDKNGCTVIALAQLLNIDYNAANKMAMNNYGRKLGQGMYTFDMLDMYKRELKKSGKTLEKQDKKKILAKVDRKNYRVKTLTSNNIKMANLRGTHVVLTRQHVAVLKGSKVVDWSMNKASHVRSVYKVVKIN